MSPVEVIDILIGSKPQTYFSEFKKETSRLYTPLEQSILEKIIMVSLGIKSINCDNFKHIYFSIVITRGESPDVSAPKTNDDIIRFEEEYIRVAKSNMALALAAANDDLRRTW
jgi:hypothetical protein